MKLKHKIKYLSYAKFISLKFVINMSRLEIFKKPMTRKLFTFYHFTT